MNDPVLSLTAASLAGRSDPHPPGSALVGSMEASIVVVVAVLLGFGGLALPAPALAAVLLGLSAAWLAVFLVAEARARRKWSSVP